MIKYIRTETINQKQIIELEEMGFILRFIAYLGNNENIMEVYVKCF